MKGRGRQEPSCQEGISRRSAGRLPLGTWLYSTHLVVLDVDGDRAAPRELQACDGSNRLLGSTWHRQGVDVVAVSQADACSAGG